MDLLNPVLKPVRSLLREEAPLAHLEQIQEHLLATGEAIRSATESIESHVAVLESLTATLNTTLPALVLALQQVGDKLDVVATALEPVVRAEADLGKVGHLLGHHHAADAPPAE